MRSSRGRLPAPRRRHEIEEACMSKEDRARIALGFIRLVNGALALAAPKRVVTMFGIDPETNGAAIYALRLFGVRTVFLGVKLLKSEGDVLEDALREAPFIHANDTASAALAGLTSQLPRRAAVTGTLLSSVNTGLALIARGDL